MSDLDNLAAHADVITAEASQANAAPVPADGAAPGAPAAAPELDNAQAVAMILGIAREGLAGVYGVQSIKVTLADEKIKIASDAIAPVLDKYGIRLGNISAGVEITALMTAGPIMWAAYAATMAELNERKRQAQQRAGLVVNPAPVPAPAPPPAASEDYHPPMDGIGLTPNG